MFVYLVFDMIPRFLANGSLVLAKKMLSIRPCMMKGEHMEETAKKIDYVYILYLCKECAVYQVIYDEIRAYGRNSKK